MNKHAKNLRTMLALLPVEVCHVYRDTIYAAVAEIDRLDIELAKQADFINQCANTSGGMVNGNRLSAKAQELQPAYRGHIPPRPIPVRGERE